MGNCRRLHNVAVQWWCQNVSMLAGRNSPDPEYARREGLGFLWPISSGFWWCIRPGGSPSCAAGPAPPSASPCRTDSTIRQWRGWNQDVKSTLQMLNIFGEKQAHHSTKQSQTQRRIVSYLFHTQYLFLYVLFTGTVCCEESFKRNIMVWSAVHLLNHAGGVIQMVSPWWGQPTLCRLQLESQSPIPISSCSRLGVSLCVTPLPAGSCSLPGLSPSQDELEDAHAGSPLALPVVWVGVQLLQCVKRLGRIEELAHLKHQEWHHEIQLASKGLFKYPWMWSSESDY